MANIESNTLLEKLTQINSIKNRLRQSIVNIGGGDYITEQSPFAAFPRALNRTFSDIKNTNRLLEYIVNGGDLNDVAEKEKLTYIDVLPYINDIQTSKQTLVDNLRVKGVLASVDETLESLVNKVLRIEGGSGATEETIYSTTVSHNEYTIQYDVIALHNSKKLIFKMTNKSGADIPGIIVKDFVSDTGDSNLISVPHVINDGEYHSLTYGYDDEYFETLIDRYKNNEIITQFDTIDYCDTYYNELFLNKIGYNDDVRQQITIYSSDYLGAYSCVTQNQCSDIESEYYYLDNGLVQLSIDLNNETFNTYKYYGSKESLSLSGYSWNTRYGVYNADQVLFLATAADFEAEELTYERVLELYEKYNGGGSTEKNLVWHITNDTDKVVALGLNYTYTDYNTYNNTVGYFDTSDALQPNETKDIEVVSTNRGSYILSLMNTDYIGCYGLEYGFTVDGDEYSSNIDISSILEEHGKQYIRPTFSIECNNVRDEDARESSVYLRNYTTDTTYSIPWRGGGGYNSQGLLIRIDISKASSLIFNNGTLWNWKPLNNYTVNDEETPIEAGAYEITFTTPCFPALDGLVFNKYLLCNKENSKYIRMWFDSDDSSFNLHNTGEIQINNLHEGLQDSSLMKLDFEEDGNNVVVKSTILESTPLTDIRIFIGEYNTDLSKFKTVIYQELYEYGNQTSPGDTSTFRIDNSDGHISFDKEYTIIIEYREVV